MFGRTAERVLRVMFRDVRRGSMSACPRVAAGPIGKIGERTTVRIRRVYEAAARERGPDLRRWYGHRPARFEAFASRYREELRSANRRADVAELRRVAARGHVTLLTATKDVDRSAAAVLADVRWSRPADRSTGMTGWP
jgi:hypothetical protein